MDTAKLEKTIEELEKAVEGHDKRLDDYSDHVERIKHVLRELIERVNKVEKRDAIQYTNTKMRDVYTVLKLMESRIKKVEEAAFSEPRPR